MSLTSNVAENLSLICTPLCSKSLFQFSNFEHTSLSLSLSLPPSEPIPLPETQPRTPITLFLPLCLCHPSSSTVAAPNTLQKEESKGIRRIGSRHQVLQRRKTGTTPREGQWLGWGWGWMRMERTVVRL